MIFSLIASAQRCGLDPFAYLRDLFTQLPTTAPDDVARLLPDAWQPLA